jgi:hypothetical protein
MADDANLKLIKEVTFLWVSKQYDRIMPYVADDAVYEIAREAIEKFSPLFGTFRGKKEIERGYEANSQAALVKAITPFCLIGDLGEFISAGDKVVNHGTMTATKTEPACDWVAIWTVESGMLKHCWMVMDTATAFLKLKKEQPNAVLG